MAFETLSNKNVGDNIKLKWDGSLRDFKILHKGKPSEIYDDSCDGIWLSIWYWNGRAYWDYNDSWATYPESDLENFVITNGFNDLDENVKKYCKTVKIPYNDPVYNQKDVVISGSNGFECQAFTLSAIEMGAITDENHTIPADGAKLDYFDAGNGASSKRQVPGSSTGDYSRWTRTRLWDAASVFAFSTDGALSSYTSRSYAGYPFCIILPPYLQVDENGNVQEPAYPTITFDDYTSGQSIGDQPYTFSIGYTIGVTSDLSLTVEECFDGTAFNTYSTSQGGAHTLITPNEDFLRLQFAQHELEIRVTDQYGRIVTETLSFNKSVAPVTISHATGFETEDLATAAAMRLLGEIPDDAEVKIELTNNFDDNSPVWEDTGNILTGGRNYAFTNQTAANGNVFNFRITLSRGPSDTGGYLSGIVGTFQGADD